MASLFGKNYQEVGKSSSPLLLRSNGETKIQWGNKFIDLIKDGKINSESKDFIYTVDTVDEITDNGLYLVSEDNSIWINIEETKVQISLAENNYVSFLTKQETNAEQKNIALTNIGLYYDTLDNVNKSQLQAGLVYVKDTNKIYLINAGVISEYQVALPSIGKFKELTIGDINIKKNSINSTSLSLSINNSNYIQLQNNSILCNVNLIADTIKSSNYINNNTGYSLYTESGISHLDIDSINWRNIDNELPKNQKSYIKYTILGEFNVITSATEINPSTKKVNDSLHTYQLTLKYTNNFQTGDYILAELERTDNTILLTTNIKQENADANMSYFSLSNTFPDSSYELEVFFDTVNGTEQQYYKLTNAIDQRDFVFQYLNTKTIKSARFVKALTNGDYLIINDYYVDINTLTKHPVNPTELLIIDSTNNSITIEMNPMLSTFLLNTSQIKIYKARCNQFIQGEGFIALRKWNGSSYEYTTIIGTYKESDFDISKDQQNRFGLYSNEVKVTDISLSGTKFSGKLPIYTETEKPETIEDKQFPTMEIVNDAINKATKDLGDANVALINKSSLPIGSIIMFNGTSIPDKWHICDGTDGTPNLIDKFIKAGTELKEESIELTKYSTETPGESTPEQTDKYKLNAYSLIFIMKMK